MRANKKCTNFMGSATFDHSVLEKSKIVIVRGNKQSKVFAKLFYFCIEVTFVWLAHGWNYVM